MMSKTNLPGWKSSTESLMVPLLYRVSTQSIRFSHTPSGWSSG